MKTSVTDKVFGFLGIFFIVLLFCCFENIENYADNVFLYNRLVQIKDCFVDGNFPFFYYNDLNGAGQGTPFYYGQVTLFPFIFFVGNQSAFIRCYFVITVLLNYFGFICFAKRYTSYAVLLADIYVCSCGFVLSEAICLLAFSMALGLSWFFFAFCVSFFRDHKSCLPCAVLFWLIFETNTNATLLSFIGCVCLFIYYFKREDLKNYIRFCLLCCLLCLYNISNILYHSDTINSAMYSYNSFEGGSFSTNMLLSLFPFHGLFMEASVSQPDQYFSLMIFPLAIYGFIVLRKHWSKRICAVLCLFVLFWFVGISYIWSYVNSIVSIPYQFPLRHAVYILGFLIVILFRYAKPKKLLYCFLTLSLLDFVIMNPFQYTIDEFPYVYEQSGRTEYLSDKFCCSLEEFLDYSSSIKSEQGYSYSYSQNEKYFIVDCSSNLGGDTILLPKIWYNGYIVQAEGVDLSIVSGYSNFCEVALGNYTGELIVYYSHPIWLLVLFVLQQVLLLFIVVKLCKNYYLLLKTTRKP